MNKIENYLPRGWITNTQENTYSTPVCDGNTLFLRGDETLYCIRGISPILKADAVTGEAPLHVNFDGHDSYSGNGKIVSFEWDFGDKTSATTSAARHDYTVPGTYAVNLTVKDEQGTAAITGKSIVVTPPDTISPKVTSLVAGYGKRIVLTFSKPVTRVSAEMAANYTINPEVKILSAQLNRDSQTVVLNAAPLADNTNYTLTLNNIVNSARMANPLAPDSKIVFKCQRRCENAVNQPV